MRRYPLLLVLLPFTVLHQVSYAKNFDWEGGSDNGPVVTQSVNGVTATVSTSNKDAQLVNAQGFEGSSGNIVFTQNFDTSSILTINFSSPVDVVSIFTLLADEDGGGERSILFTPKGGSNSPVVEGIAQSLGKVVNLDWTGVTAIILSVNGGGVESFGVDDIVWTPSDTTPPLFEANTPSQFAVTQSEFALRGDLDEAGRVFYVVVPDGASSPTSAEVKAGTGPSGVPAVASGNAMVSGGTHLHTFVVSGLTAGTDYDVYMVAEDVAVPPNLQASPERVSVTMAPIELTIIGLTGDNKEYDGTTVGSASGTASLQGVVAGDSVIFGGQPVYTFTSAEVGTGITMTSSGFTISGPDAQKYTLIQPTYTAEIQPKLLMITGLTGDNKGYDGTIIGSASGTASLQGVVAGDSVIFGGQPVYTFTSAEVGTGITMTSSGFTISGPDAQKYTLIQPTYTAEIQPKPLMIIGLTGDTKEYDGTVIGSASGTASLQGVVAGDSVILGGQPVSKFESAGAGREKPLITSGYTIGGGNAGNYTLIQPIFAADITGQALQITRITMVGDSSLMILVKGGTAFHNSDLIATTNLAAALGEWEVLASGVFDVQGNLSLTIAIDPNTLHRFFRAVDLEGQP